MSSNANKERILGEPYGTACNKLRKSILFSLVLEMGRNTCFKCGQAITNISELTIEHMTPFTDSSSFYDLNNIAFSHAKCNRAYGVKPGEFRHNSYGYQRGCRCDVCKQAVRPYRYKSQIRYRNKPLKEIT